MELKTERVQSNQRPDERTKDKQNISQSEQVIFKPKLNGRKGNIKNKIECKRQGHHPRNVFGKRLVKHRTKRNSYNRIQHGPHRSKKPARRSPRWFDECFIPGVGRHGTILALLTKIRRVFVGTGGFLGEECFCGGGDVRKFEPKAWLSFGTIDKSIRELRAMFKVHPEWFETPHPESSRGKNEVDYSI